MNAPFSADASVPTPQSSPVLFTGHRGQLLKILIVGSLCQIPTLGFYRFWLITKIRRHFWANTQIAGETFEYTGTAKELLIGFLFALAVLAPIYIASFLLGTVLEEWEVLGSIPVFVALYAFGHFGVYRARRYRATRTVFRGVRFWMTGRGWSYAARAILWDFAKILTLGLALPWAMASLERYRMQHTYFGSVQGDFIGTGWTLFKRGIWVWISGLIGFALSAAVIRLLPFSSMSYFFFPLLVLLALVIPAALLWPIAMAIFTRWQIEGIRFGEVSLSSNLRKAAFFGAFIKLIASACGLIVATIGLAASVVSLAWPFFRNAFEILKVGDLDWSAGVVIVLSVLAYLLLALGIGVLQRYFIGRGLWTITAQSIEVTNMLAIEAVVAAGQPAGLLGEGLADALDFNVGL